MHETYSDKMSRRAEAVSAAKNVLARLQAGEGIIEPDISFCDVRKPLYSAQRGLCGICRRYGKVKSMNIDHVVPLARGGGDYRNLMLTHYPCNERKGSRMPTGCELIFLAVVNARLG